MRWGEDATLPNDRETRACTHNLPNVYGEMLLQICRDYSGLPDVRTMTIPQIRFYYDGLRHDLQQATARKKG